jgi:hypothetical protein
MLNSTANAPMAVLSSSCKSERLKIILGLVFTLGYLIIAVKK